MNPKKWNKNFAALFCFGLGVLWVASLYVCNLVFSTYGHYEVVRQYFGWTVLVHIIALISLGACIKYVELDNTSTKSD